MGHSIHQSVTMGRQHHLNSEAMYKFQDADNNTVLMILHAW